MEKDVFLLVMMINHIFKELNANISVNLVNIYMENTALKNAQLDLLIMVFVQQVLALSPNLIIILQLKSIILNLNIVI